MLGIAVFRGDRPLDRHLDVAVVKDTERRVAAVLNETFFTVPAHCSISNLPVAVEPAKVDLRTAGFEVIP